MTDPNLCEHSDTTSVPRWGSFVAIGDSFTEGMMDINPDPQARENDMMIGWADRVAAHMSRLRIDAGQTPLLYANLAIRGRKIDQIYAEQLGPALDMRPDLISIVAGGNDLLRVGTDVDKMAEKFETMVRRAKMACGDVLVITGYDVKDSPLLSLTRGLGAIYNMHIVSIAQKYDCFLVNQWGLASLHHVDAWADDHLHLTTLGHRVLADAVLDALGLEPNNPDYATQLPPRARSSFDWRENISWMKTHVVPWMARHARGRSSGDGRSPKYASLRPVIPDIPDSPDSH